MDEEQNTNNGHKNVRLSAMRLYDFLTYDALLRKVPHFAEDFYEWDSLLSMMKISAVEAWMVYDGFQEIGWCAIQTPSPHHPDNDSIHLLGIIVDPDFQSKGYGTAITSKLIEMYGHTHPLTASVVDRNMLSERMLKKSGFKKGLPQDQWITWHKPCENKPLALFLGDHDSFKILKNNTETLPPHWTFRPWRYKLFQASKPVEGGHGAITRGLWPDPAAFSVITLAASHLMQSYIPEWFLENGDSI